VAHPVLQGSRYFAASFQRKFKAASGQVEVTPLTDSGKGKEVVKTVENEVESGKVKASAITMAIVLGTNLICLQL
jgi:hypothetical protein